MAIPFKIQKVFPMPHRHLRHLDGAMLEVELSFSNELRQVQGRAKYVKSDPVHGPVLKILIDDLMGEFEILLPELTWQGPLEPSDIPGCDFRLSLARAAG
jgi:hypothetical protein